MNYYHTKDIKLASCLIALGCAYREVDPITHLITEDDQGRRQSQYTFWFDLEKGDSKSICTKVVEAFFKWRDNGEYVLDREHPLYYMLGALANRDTLLHWIKSNVEPMRVINDGHRVIILSDRADQKTKDKIRKHL
jgi:hypothetical protein